MFFAMGALLSFSDATAYTASAPEMISISSLVM
jgi:hypothetical protein